MTNLNAATYKSFGDTSLAVYQSEFERVDSPMLPDVTAIYTALKGYSALALGQMWLENQYATTGQIIKPQDHNPLSLRPWEGDPRATKTGDVLKWDTRQKVGTIKVPTYADGAIVARDGSMMLRFPTFVAGVTEWRRRLFDDPGYKGGVYGKATTLESMLNIYAPPGDVHPETGADNADIGYAETVRKMLAKFAKIEILTPSDEPAGGVIVPEEPPMEFKRYVFPGLKNPVYLPAWIAVELKLLPASTPGWTSGQYVDPNNFTSTTYHDTQNDESSATGEYNWAATGGRAQIGSPGSYNGIFDNKKLIIAQRFDELVGHAANPTGNVTSYAFEEAYGSSSHEEALEVGMWVHAGVLQAMGTNATKSMYQHNAWSGKNCPKQIREDTGPKNWTYVEKTVDARILQIIAYIAGGAPTTTPPPITPPVQIEEVPGLPIDSSPTKGQSVFTVDGTDYLLVNDLFRTKSAVKRQRNEKGDTFGDAVKPADTPFVGAYIYRFKNDPANPWKLISAWKSRFLLSDLERVNDIIPSAGV